ncbi:MAG: mechanosensitive ion channel family protein [Myxococcota bacterium]
MHFDWRQIFDQVQAQIVSSGLRIMGLMFILFVVLRSTGWVTRKVLNRSSKDGDVDEDQRRLNTIAAVVAAVLRFAVLVVGTIMLLQEVGFDVGPLIASAGILGVAVGFGSQQLVKDFLTGFFILMENQYRVGDSVKLAGCEGVVEQITLRTTWIRDLSGSMFIIPNSKIDVVTNQTFDWARAVVEVGFSYAANLDDAVKRLQEVLASMQNDPAWKDTLLDAGAVNCVERLDPGAVVLRVVVKTRALKQWGVQRELRKRIVEKLGQGEFQGLVRQPAAPLAAAKDVYKIAS